MSKLISKLSAACMSLTLSHGGYALEAEANSIDHLSFNRIAAELNLPLFWELSKDKSEALVPENVHVLWGVSEDKSSKWIKNGRFTTKFFKAYQSIISIYNHGYDESKINADEKKRRELVRKELASGLPTLVYSDFTQLDKNQQHMVKHVMKAAQYIETIYAKQNGSYIYRDAIKHQDVASKMLFYRNQGPWCSAPGVSEDPACNALKERPKKISGLYPISIQQDTDFCSMLSGLPNASELMGEFTTVVDLKGVLTPVPYHEAYKRDMKKVSKELALAAKALNQGEEPYFKHYLEEASLAFLTNDWLPADEAWASMNANNSKWYLRIGPDEVYYDPCGRKAGFHVSFATINEDSKIWQEKLEPYKSDMEVALAELAGKPYESRPVSFHLPDFIDIVINAGNSRSAQGATIGQSLPNWGPVANEGRGRTVAMTNLYSDSDSMNNYLTQSISLLCQSSIADYSEDFGAKTMGVVLHEAAHNLGPAHEYKVEGKTATEIFGGPMASMLEELKAQTASLYFVNWLVDKGVVTQTMAHQSHNSSILWAFGHIAQGMYDSDGNSKAYSQLSAIQFGYFMDNGAISWHPDMLAANGVDKGCFNIDQDKLPAAIYSLTKEVASLKAQGDVSRAENLKKTYVDQAGDKQALMKVIAERWLRQPKSSFVYSIGLGEK